MASAAFVTEFRSFMTFESETSTQFSNLKHFNNVDHRMAPQEIPILINNKDLVVNVPQNLRNHESPISSPGTSLESSGSSPDQPHEEILDINPLMMHHSSSDDSDCAEECSDHLKQMEGVLEKNGILRQNLSCGDGINEVDMDDDSLLGTHETYDLNDSRSAIPVCHFCQYTAETREEYNKHIHTHFQFKCTQCSYMARTKGRLENHMKNHREAPDNWGQYSLTKGLTENGNHGSSKEEHRLSKKDRSTRCKTCGFLGKNKTEYYEHLRKKICFTGPLLECEFEGCEFCTRYKHHFEYHLRNHYGSKPFKCDQCNYVCVNQSMLNSHMKSHSSQYPYRCKTCTYATKYLHSLKMHVKKYDHEPDKVLNADGSVNHNLIIDVNGRRRGPKSKKGKSSNSAANHRSSSAIVPLPPSHASPPSKNYHQNASLPSINPSFMYNSSMFNNMAGNGFLQPPMLDPSMGFGFPPFWNMGNLRCNLPRCDYVAESTEGLQQHMVAHTRQFLYEKYGRNSDAFPRERHFTPESVQELESRYQNIIGNATRAQQAVENFTRPQVNNHFQPQTREAIETNRNPAQFKMPENSIVEYGVRRGFSPPLNNGNLSPFSSAGRHSEESKNSVPKDFLENQESFNVQVPVQSSRSSSLSPPSVEHARGSSGSSGSFEALDNCSSPLDLTSNVSVAKSKNTSPMSPATEKDKNWENAESVAAQPQRSTKNRRKGKAFKIDQYMQYEDHSSEFLNPSLYPKTLETNIKMEVEDLSTNSPLGMNGKLQNSNMEKPESYVKVPEKSFHVRRESSPKASFQTSPKHTSTPKVSSPVSVGGHLNRNSHPSEVPTFNSYINGQPNRNSHYSEVPTANGYINGYKSNIQQETGINANFLNGDKFGASKKASTISNGVSSPSSNKEANVDEQQELGDKHKCPHCDIGFGDFVMLVMHMTCHSMGNPFLCAKCGENCKNRIGFMDHMINYCKRR
ncbi:hypothetical protein JTE90_020928 [Oedothorax gibbosus]|uniref:Protein hunchback n=1 Tax=Oedothorax gibbosus TaxID=931172 RepID=A0AAV6VN39_9ARAC|nr:hypothetical protein JTE90_020928 [Oedothorax gibbosus]